MVYTSDTVADYAGQTYGVQQVMLKHYWYPYLLRHMSAAQAIRGPALRVRG